MSNGPKTGWGGTRPGAGRPKDTYSAQQIRKMLKLAKKFAKKHGKSIDEVILGFIYDDDMATTHRFNSIKLWKEITMPKISEGGAADKALGPGIYLPTEKPDLSVVVPIKKTG